MTAQTLHDWHRTTFTKRTEVELVAPARTTDTGQTIPERRTMATLNLARTVIAQRIYNALPPAEKAEVQAAFDASDAGKALDSKDAGERAEHAELWALKALFEAKHETMPAVGELALQQVVQVHAHPSRLVAHRGRFLAAMRTAKASVTPVVGAPAAPAVVPAPAPAESGGAS